MGAGMDMDQGGEAGRGGREGGHFGRIDVGRVVHDGQEGWPGEKGARQEGRVAGLRPAGAVERSKRTGGGGGLRGGRTMWGEMF